MSCKVQYDGVYIDDTDGLYKLSLNKGLFIYQWKLDNNVSGFCRDTLSYGTVENVNNHPLLKLSSYDDQYTSILNIKVEELSVDKSDIKFNILNPIEDNHAMYNFGNDNARVIEYSLVIDSECYRFQKQVNKMIFNTNSIVIPNDSDCQIKSFEIIIRPRNYLSDWNDHNKARIAYTLEHNVVLENANVFNVEINKLSYCFLAAERLSGDFILINKDKSLEWNDRIFIKQ